MITESEQHNIAAIRTLLQDAFTADTLWRFCQERAEFRPVLFEVGRNAGLAEMIDALTQHCQTQLLFNELLLAVREVNPRQYERYQSQLYSDGAVFLPASQVPHNLPPRSEFVGREAEKARIHKALRSRYFLISIDGIGGIGKTSLALEVAYECLHASQSDNPPERIVTFYSFVWATAKDRELTLNVLLDAVALTLDYPGIVQRPLDQKRIGVEKLLRQKPCLLVVDNFESVTDDELQDFLRYLPEPSKALITTRKQNLNHVLAISLQGLAEAEALALVRGEGQRLGLTSIREADDKTLLYLQEATGGVPLALKWSVGQIKQRGQTLDGILTALHEARGSIFEDIFARSWGLLSPDARRVLMVMPLFATSASRAAIEAASDVHHFALSEALGQLVEMFLVDATNEIELTRQRYSTHPLTRAFAEAKVQCELETRQVAQKRWADYFFAFTKKHGYFWDYKSFPYLEIELPNIMAVIDSCWEQGLEELGTKIASNLRNFLVTCGYWNDVIVLGHKVVEQSTKLGDELSVAIWRVGMIGWVQRHRGDLESAEQQTVQALKIFEQLEERSWIAYSKRSLGRIAQERGQFEHAENLLKEALEYYRLAEGNENERMTIFIIGNIAQLALDRGDLDTAHTLSESILPAATRHDDRERMGHLLDVLGGVARRRSNLQKAKGYFEEALEHMEKVARRDEVADISLELADVEIEMGEVQTARRRLTKAMDEYQRLDILHKAHDVESLLDRLASKKESANGR